MHPRMSVILITEYTVLAGEITLAVGVQITLDLAVLV